MGVATALMTVDDFREFAEANPLHRYELHDGMVVEVTQPKLNHQHALRTLFRLLDAKLSAYGEVFPECAYRGTPEYNGRRSDVGFISAARWREAWPLNEFFGAPDLVVEILSPSNRPGDMRKREAFCFAHGCRSFWTVDLARRTVRVSFASGLFTIYDESGAVPLAPFSSESVSVADILAV